MSKGKMHGRGAGGSRLWAPGRSAVNTLAIAVPADDRHREGGAGRRRSTARGDPNGSDRPGPWEVTAARLGPGRGHRRARDSDPGRQIA